MNVVRATEATVAEVQRWTSARGLGRIQSDMFSGLGFSVPGVAAWWLYLTDSSIAYTGFLAGNPDLPGVVRGAGLDAVIERVFAEARAAGTRAIFIPVDIPAVRARLERHGMSVVSAGYSLMVANFGDPERPAPCRSED